MCYFYSIYTNQSFKTYTMIGGNTLMFYSFDDIQDFTNLATEIYC